MLIKPTLKLSILLLAACFCLPGCGGGGSGDQPDMGRVSGTVTMDDKPLANAQVFFNPEAGGRASSAVTDNNGKYELSYTEEVQGAKIGKHKVSITTFAEENLEELAADEEGGVPIEGIKETIPAKYNTSTELSEEVKAGSQTIDFKLKSN